MQNNDTLTRQQLREKIQQAVKSGDTEAFTEAFNQMVEAIGQDVLPRPTAVWTKCSRPPTPRCWQCGVCAS